MDHVLASGKNVKLLVLDTEVYSNTGGQMSKSTPRGAVAKFAAGGKRTPKKDLALMAMTHGTAYVARVAMGASDTQTLTAFREAEAFDGPALIIAYSHCIAHGYDLVHGMEQQKAAVQSGYWPLVRFNPALREQGKNPFILDSRPPSLPLAKYIYNETRYTMLVQAAPATAKELLRQAEQDVAQRWRLYEHLAAIAPGGQVMIDLTTHYLGLKLRNPLVCSASPLCQDLDALAAHGGGGSGGRGAALAVRGADRAGEPRPGSLP